VLPPGGRHDTGITDPADANDRRAVVRA